MTQTQWLIVIIIGVLLSLVVRAVFELVRSRREKPAYRAVAGAMGLNYAEDVATDSLPRKDEFDIPDAPGFSKRYLLPLEDFHHVGDRLRHIIDDQDLTYHAYHNLGPQTESLTVLANLGIDGGVEAVFKILDSPLGKMGFKLRLLMAVLPKYGAAAKPHLPRLRELAPGGRFDKPWKEMIQAIEEAEGPAKAISFEEAMKAGK